MICSIASKKFVAFFGIPKKIFSCVETMLKPTANAKPATTGYEKKSIKKPRRAFFYKK